MRRALIDVHSGNLTLRVNDEEVKFNICHTMKFPNEAQSCNHISVVDDCVMGVIDRVLSDKGALFSAFILSETEFTSYRNGS